MVGPRVHDLSQQCGAGCMVSPAETPQVHRHPMAWRPEDLVDDNSNVLVVDQAGRAEVTGGLAQFKSETDLTNPPCDLASPH